jgi:hypothetical protein
MQRFESYVREMLSDEAVLMGFIQEHLDNIEWD